MGIVILPGILVSFIAFIVSLYFAVKAVRNKELSLTHVGIGLLLSIILFSGTIFSFWVSGKIYVLAPLLRIPMVQFIIPLIVLFLVRKDNPGEMTATLKVLACSILISGTCLLLFGKHVDPLIEYLNIETYH